MRPVAEAVLAAGVSLMLMATPAEADIVRGIGKILGGVLTVPVAVLQGTVQGPPLFGTAVGALNGVLKGAEMIVGGVFDIAASAISAAKSAAPFVLPFVF